MEIKENPNAFYRSLAERFREDVIGSKLYLNPRLSLDEAAARLRTSRYELSHAVNSCLGTSFCGFVNELRIAESVRLMQSPDGGEMKIRRIAELSGFHDRKNFMRVCKQITGMSPSELKAQYNN